MTMISPGVGEQHRLQTRIWMHLDAFKVFLEIVGHVIASHEGKHYIPANNV